MKSLAFFRATAGAMWINSAIGKAGLGDLLWENSVRHIIQVCFDDHIRGNLAGLDLGNIQVKGNTKVG